LGVMNKFFSTSHILQRIRAEYLEMPGLSLKPEQVERLCGIDRGLCRDALDVLVATGFLSMRADGAYGRDKNPDISRARPAKATLEAVNSTVARLRSRAS
jgi:hypothetical protein